MSTARLVLRIRTTCIDAISAIEAITARKPAKVNRYIYMRPASPPLIKPKELAANCVSHVDIKMQAVLLSASSIVSKEEMAD